jgi:hypothetical protein
MVPWFFWVVPAVFVIRWTVLWWGTRQARLRFALHAPLGALAGVVLGVVVGIVSQRDRSCFGDDCRGDLAGFLASVDASTGLAELIVACSLSALLTSAVLSSVTVVVETVLMVRRHERNEALRNAAHQETASAGAPPRPPVTRSAAVPASTWSRKRSTISTTRSSPPFPTPSGETASAPSPLPPDAPRAVPSPRSRPPRRPEPVMSRWGGGTGWD